MEIERRVNQEWPNDVPRYAWRRFKDQSHEYQLTMTHLHGQLDRHECYVSHMEPEALIPNRIDRRINLGWPAGTLIYAWRRFEDLPHDQQLQLRHLQGQIARYEAMDGR